MKKNKIVALLPMKAHSERVKGKNFREFAGKPLYRWILDTLLSIDDIDLVVINTDARELLERENVHLMDRVLIRDRKPELCGDMTSMNLILADDIKEVSSDIYAMTHTTNPLLSAKSIIDAIGGYQEGVKSEGRDSLFTVNRVQTRFYRADGSPVNHAPNKLLRTQDLEPWFEENSNLYLFTRDSFQKSGARIGLNPMMYEMSKIEALDIDDVSDWVMAESLALRLSAGASVLSLIG